jgi:hypothetical protein
LAQKSRRAPSALDDRSQAIRPRKPLTIRANLGPGGEALTLSRHGAGGGYSSKPEFSFIDQEYASRQFIT